jgi:hypothetical protein
VDGDNLLDALILVYDGFTSLDKTAVVGWRNTPSGAGQAVDTPTLPALESSQPNPTAGPASIAFTLPGRSRVQLAIYDVTGRLVAELADGTLAGGSYSIPWDGKDDAGRMVASGTYFYQITVDGREESKRIVVIR